MNEMLNFFAFMIFSLLIRTQRGDKPLAALLLLLLTPVFLIVVRK